MTALIPEDITSSSSITTLPYDDFDSGEVEDIIKTEENQVTTEGSSSPLPIYKTDDTTKPRISEETRSRYHFIDIDPLSVKINDLDKEYRPPDQLNINAQSPDNHPSSRIVDVKGDTSIIIYNRLPQCLEFTMGSLLQSLSNLHSYTYIPSQIYVPFSYNSSSLGSIARSINQHPYKHLIYERHIYFFDFYALHFLKHPIWINLVRDPIHRVAAEYERSRKICRELGRCFIAKDTLNETLDECVAKRSAQYCILPDNGISRMVPFFCGLRYPDRCQQANHWVVEQAKQNINIFYTVIGFAEQFYKFLYVLEKLLPQYFKLARLLFMNQSNASLPIDPRDTNTSLPNQNTTETLKPLLKYEYELYDYIKTRFLEQYELLVELDN